MALNFDNYADDLSAYDRSPARPATAPRPTVTPPRTPSERSRRGSEAGEKWEKESARSDASRGSVPSNTYHSGVIHSTVPGHTKVEPSPYHKSVQRRKVEAPPPAEYHSGTIKAGAQGATYVVPSPTRSPPSKPHSPHKSGVIHAASLGYTAITPGPSDIAGMTRRAPAVPEREHPIYGAAPGNTSASPIYKRPHGGLDPFASPGPASPARPSSAHHSGVIVSGSPGYTVVHPVGADLASPKSGRSPGVVVPDYASSPIRTTKFGQTNAGRSVDYHRAEKELKDHPVEGEPRYAPAGASVHGEIHYNKGAIKEGLAQYVSPETRSRDAERRARAGASPNYHSRVIRTTTPGYTNVSL